MEKENIKKETFYTNGDSKNPFVKKNKENLPSNRIWMRTKDNS